MVQNIQHWLLERDQFTWARENVSATKWFQVTKYFPGYKLRRQMLYVDAETGAVIPAEGGEEVPQGKVFFYGLDLRNFCGIEIPGLEEAMSATRKSRMEARSGGGHAESPPSGGASSSSPAPAGGAGNE